MPEATIRGAPGGDRARCLFRPVGDTDGAPGALLVRLRAPEADCESVGPIGHIGNVQADQLAPAERAREAEQEECPIPTSCRVGTKTLEHRAQLSHGDRVHLALGRPEGPSHATAHEADRHLLGRAVVARGPVGGGDRGQTGVDRRGLGQIGHIAGYGFGSCGQRCHPVLVAPGGELGPVGAVEPVRILGPARSKVVPRVGNNLGHLAGPLDAV